MADISFIWILPFALMLLAIAILPLTFPHFWEKNSNKALVAAVISLPTAIFLIVNDPHALLHSAKEYFSFICLLGSLFVISGGVFLEGDLKATPSINAAFLGTGAILASIIGTTGASMLLIRPLLSTNRERKNTRHLPLFFIFMVSNIGGLLTPIGDPPLFLGFLRGVPFFWTFKLFPIWLFCNSILLITFILMDRRQYHRETKKSLREDEARQQPLKIRGMLNIFLLMGVVAAVFLPTPYREGCMIALSLISLKKTPENIHRRNNFNFHPIIEVAVLFAGIFIAMVPALALLKLHGAEFGLYQPYQFYWTAGALSAFLDNAPTYLTFFSLAEGLSIPGPLVAGVSEALLAAISCGAVMMGSLTYIGNGPNFMVKAICDKSGIKTPSFVGYMAYSFGILIPLFLIVTFVFFI